MKKQKSEDTEDDEPSRFDDDIVEYDISQMTQEQKDYFQQQIDEMPESEKSFESEEPFDKEEKQKPLID
jgi:hypothetical protein